MAGGGTWHSLSTCERNVSVLQNHKINSQAHGIYCYKRRQLRYEVQQQYEYPPGEQWQNIPKKKQSCRQRQRSFGRSSYSLLYYHMNTVLLYYCWWWCEKSKKKTSPCYDNNPMSQTKHSTTDGRQSSMLNAVSAPTPYERTYFEEQYE